VAKILELADFPQRDGVTQVHVDAGGVDAILDPQRATGPATLFQPLRQFLLGDDLLDTTTEDGQLLGDGGKRHGPAGGLPGRCNQRREVEREQK